MARGADTFETAQHEAAHIVVGVAVGLRLERATARPTRGAWGETWFAGEHRGLDTAFALMYAAGIAWDRALGLSDYGSSLDARYCRELVGKRGVEACTLAASAILATRGGIHARVTRALLEHDLTMAHVEALAKGEPWPE